MLIMSSQENISQTTWPVVSVDSSFGETEELVVPDYELEFEPLKQGELVNGVLTKMDASF